MNPKPDKNHRIRPGCQVRVHHEPEIMKTLDEFGRSDGLPFMPEMRRFCGGVYAVLQCVNRILIEGNGVRGFDDIFILKDIRCDGSAHAGCQRWCHIFWKASWLDFEGNNNFSSNIPGKSSPVKPDEYSVTSCQGQATVLCGATRQLSLFNFQQYKMDWQTGTRSRFDVAVMLWHMAAKRFCWRIQKILRFFFFKQPLITYQPSSLTSGDLVQVRSKEEIKGLLDRNCKTQGLLFAHAMWKYCGKQFQVFEKVEHTIIEETGAFRKMRDTFLLKDVTCDGKAFRGCPRSCFWFWKGAWLKKIEYDDMP